jgi:hypothetical protein
MALPLDSNSSKHVSTIAPGFTFAAAQSRLSFFKCSAFRSTQAQVLLYRLGWFWRFPSGRFHEGYKIGNLYALIAILIL